MADRSLRGVYPILSMPFDQKGRIDLEDLRAEVEFAIAAGVHGLGIALASEVFKLSESERDLVLKTVVEQVNGRVKVVMNTGAPGTDLAVQYSQRAQELGADAVMVLPPTFMPVTGREVREYFRRISDAISIPIFMQDTATSPIPASLAAQICQESENACYLKAENPPTPTRVAEAKALAGDRLIVFGGAGGNFLLEELRRGAVGTMPGCALPEMYVRVWDLYQAGQDDQAQEEFNRYTHLLKYLGHPLGLAYWFTKEVLRLRGVFKTNYVRHPAHPPDELGYRELRRLVEMLGLVKAPV